MAMDTLARWSSHADIGGPDDCWPWNAQRTAGGYGMFRIGRKRTTASRAGYELLVAPIAAGYEIDHLCRNRCCVNPAHLEAVTPAENKRRAVVAEGDMLPNGRKTHCPAGHEYAGANLYTPEPRHRVCKTCSKERGAAWARSHPERTAEYQRTYRARKEARHL